MEELKNEDYLIIDKKVLPQHFEMVIQVKENLNKGLSVSDACKKVGISRSTFYKYKDYVNRPSMKMGKRVILSLKLMDEPGTLSDILNEIASYHANVLSINQEIPIHKIAFVTLTIAFMNAEISIQNLVSELKNGKNVIDVSLVAVE